MYSLFEQSDTLSTPVECFLFDTAAEVFPVKPHWHYFIEMIYMLEGTAEMHCEDNTYRMTPGEMILFPSQSVHSIYAADTGQLSYAVLKFDMNQLGFHSTYVPRLRSVFKQAHQKQLPIVFSAEEADVMDCKKIFLDCVAETKAQRYGYDLVIKAKLYELTLSIIRHWQTLGFVIDHDALVDDSQYDIDSITAYIDEHLQENLQVRDIAKKCRLSYSCFAKKFHAFYSMSCKEYMERMRIFKVEELLLFTDFDLNHISLETGFSDCSHMIKSFKAHRDMTPRQYRQAHKHV